MTGPRRLSTRSRLALSALTVTMMILLLISSTTRQRALQRDTLELRSRIVPADRVRITVTNLHQSDREIEVVTLCDPNDIRQLADSLEIVGPYQDPEPGPGTIYRISVVRGSSQKDTVLRDLRFLRSPDGRLAPISTPVIAQTLSLLSARNGGEFQPMWEPGTPGTITNAQEVALDPPDNETQPAMPSPIR